MYGVLLYGIVLKVVCGCDFCEEGSDYFDDVVDRYVIDFIFYLL